jgi:hypothetical protein
MNQAFGTVGRWIREDIEFSAWCSQNGGYVENGRCWVNR